MMSSNNNSQHAGGSGGTGHTFGKSIAATILSPPPGFTWVEESIARCWRISDMNIPFLRSSTFGAIINVSGDHLDYAVQYYCKQEANIPIHNLFVSGPSPLSQSVSSVEAFVKRALELILKLAVSVNPVLIMGSEYNIDNVVVACLRRVQEWSFISILGELRMNAGCRFFDVEQFVENFDPDQVDIAQNTPEFLQIHYRVKEEEIKLLHRLKSDKQITIRTDGQESEIGDRRTDKSMSMTGGTSEDVVTDVMLEKIFFSNKLLALSPGSVYDPSVSLINDKDDDD